MWGFEEEWRPEAQIFDYLAGRMAVFERLKRSKRCDHVGGSVSLGLGFEVSKEHARPSSLSSFWM